MTFANLLTLLPTLQHLAWVTAPVLVAYFALSLFFGLYICAVALYQQHIMHTLPRAGYIFGAPWLLVMITVDIFFQYTIVAAIYREWPPRGEYTVTKRLQRWKRTAPTSLRGRWSANLCKLLNLFTPPQAPHC